MTYGRYGKGSDDQRLYPMFLGYDTLVRGYNYGSFTAQEVDPETKDTFDFNRLWGSRMMVANFELRFPLFGALGIGKGFYGIFPVDFLAFYDVGVAWDSTNSPRLPILSPHGIQKPISSAGFGLRVNLLGYLVLGVNYVWPFDRPLYSKSGYWQFSFYPGF
jgi:outer membrane protein assembly factor BamA